MGLPSGTSASAHVSREPPAPLANAEPGVHEAAHRLLAPWKGSGRVLYDLATGYGALAQWAHDAGFEVTAVDLARGAFARPQIPFRAVDLNRAWSIPDGVADVVVALEIVEHLENHFAFMREAARVLRPGGHLLVSTPNEHCIANRWAYLRTGFFGSSRTVIWEGDPNLPARHVHPATLPHLELSWRMAGFTLERFEISARSGLATCLLPLYPLQALSLRQRMLGRRVPPEQRELNRRLLPLFQDLRIFLGRTVVFLLRKAEPAAHPGDRAGG
jgi:SAM-dependent methyltransferase